MAGEFLRSGISLHQQPRLLGVGIDQDDAGPKQLVMFRYLRLQCLRNSLSLGKDMFVEFEGLSKNEFDLLMMRSGAGLSLLKRFQPVTILLSQEPRLIGIVWL